MQKGAVKGSLLDEEASRPNAVNLKIDESKLPNPSPRARAGSSGFASAPATEHPGGRESASSSANVDANNNPDSPKEDDPLVRLLAALGPEEYYEILEVSANGVQKLETLPENSTRSGYKRGFILRRKTTEQKAREAAVFTSDVQSSDRYDYEKKYPQDEEGKGMDSSARVWRVYLDEAGQFDLNMVEGIKDTVDIMLVSAGLFSAIVSTLVGQAYLSLQQDFTKVTSSLLMELIEVQRAVATQTPLGSIPRSSLVVDSPFIASSTDRWVNGLWFTSLTISVSTALIAVLVKQWIQAYVAPTFGTPRDQSRTRHFRYMGIKAWHVPLIVGLLPTLLHLSLFLFLLDLVVLLFSLDLIIAIVVLCITALAYTVYAVANLLPVWKPECPYKTPLSAFAFNLIRPWRPVVRGWINWIRHRVGLADNDRHDGTYYRTLRDMEVGTVQRIKCDEVDAHALNWLCSISANPSVATTVVHAISDLPLTFSAKSHLRSGRCMGHICAELQTYNPRLSLSPRLEPYSASASQLSRYYVYLHAHLQLTSSMEDGPSSIARSGCTDVRCIEAAPQCYHGFLDLNLEPRLTPIQYTFLSPFHRAHEGIGGVWSTPHWTTAEKLTSLLTACTSQRARISVLRRAIIGVMRGERAPTFSISDLQHLISLLRSRSTRPNLMPWEFPEEETRVEQSPASELADLLLVAYVLHATGVEDIVIADHDDLHDALYYEDRLTSRWATEDHAITKTSTATKLDSSQICIHLLVHFSRNPSGMKEPRYMLDNLHPVIDLMLGMSLAKCSFEGAGKHPLPDLLNELLPTPSAVCSLTEQHKHDLTSLIPHFTGLTKLSLLLFKFVQHPQMPDIFVANDCLFALALITEHLFQLQPDFLHQLAPLDELIPEAITEYISAAACLQGPHAEQHLKYISDELATFCVCLIVWENGVGYWTSVFTSIAVPLRSLIQDGMVFPQRSLRHPF